MSFRTHTQKPMEKESWIQLEFKSNLKSKSASALPESKFDLRTFQNISWVLVRANKRISNNLEFVLNYAWKNILVNWK